MKYNKIRPTITASKIEKQRQRNSQSYQEGDVAQKTTRVGPDK
jgi:hypothetical protein